MKKRVSSKESTSRLLNRYIWLVDLIYRKGEISFDEINDYWVRSSELNPEGNDLPLRTFHNHRQAIQTLFDINISCNRGNDYRYYIENSGDIARDAMRKWLISTLSVNNLIHENHKIRHRVLFEEIPSGQKFLTPILEAMHENRRLLVTYQSFWKDEPSTFEVQPLCVKVFRQRWYLIANSVYIKHTRAYGLDRILELTHSDSTFEMLADFDARELYNDSYGIIIEDEIYTEEVLLKVSENQSRYIQALPLHHSQTIVQQTEDYTIFRYMIKPTFDFRQELLSHGSQVEVLAPTWFREELAGEVKKMNALYNKAESVTSE